MPHGPRLSLNLRSIAGQRIRDGRLPVTFSLVVDAGYGADTSCDVCERQIEQHRVRYEEADVRTGNSMMFHLACHAAWQLECLKYMATGGRHVDETAM